MDEADKARLTTTIGATGLMFLLVTPHPSCPRQNLQSCKMVVCVCVCMVVLIHRRHRGTDEQSTCDRTLVHRMVKTNLDLLEQEIVSGSGSGWALCKSAPYPKQITTPALHQRVFYRPDALPAAEPTASKH